MDPIVEETRAALRRARTEEAARKAESNGDGRDEPPPADGPADYGLNTHTDGTSTTDISVLGEWDAGDDHESIPPRGWLLGNVFCRRFVSSLLADGGVGKTALRYAQLMSLAIGRSLTGEHVFQRCRVLIVSLEDDVDFAGEFGPCGCTIRLSRAS
jgi:AAA domain